MENASVNKGRIILEAFSKQKTLAKSELLTAVSYDGMPKGSARDSGDSVVVDQITAKMFCSNVKRAIKLIGDDYPEYADYLSDYYLHHKTKTAIAIELNISRRSIYNVEKKALYYFAEIIPEEIYDYVLYS